MPLYRDNSSRLSRIKDLVASNYSHSIWEDRDDGPDMEVIKRGFFLRLELNLDALAERDWRALLQKVIPIFKRRHVVSGRDRGWQLAFDIFNEAEAYRWLASKGFADLQFIPELGNKRTPDIAAFYRQEKWLCEVKTVNLSDKEIELRTGTKVRESSDRLEDSFLNTKLKCLIEQAGRQFENHSSERRLLIIIFNFDDSLHEFVESHLEQIQTYLIKNKTGEFDFALLARPFGNMHTLPMKEWLVPAQRSLDTYYLL